MVSLMGCCAGAAALVPARPGVRLGPLLRLSRPRRVRGWWWAAVCLVGAVVAGAVPWSVVASGGIAATTGGIMVRSRLRRARRERQRQQLAAVLGGVCQQVRSGADPAAAMRRAVAEHERLDARVRQRLLLMVSGVGEDPSGAEEIPELRTVARVWEAVHRHGVACAPLLGRVHAALDKDLRHASATRARLMGPQSTAVVLTLLPLAGVGMGTMMGANPLGLLLGGGVGGMMLMAGTTLVCAGALWSQALIQRAGGQR
ncbi:type II secretion protein F [Corynebacterium sp. zg-331]|uniref:type II secretion protein F n=1 Tax=unclassified Corynebacterium TaxID=2624378 RepID=UPI00128BF882|nr:MULTISPECIES: type II secretion protein F [unclassified Corynebacterium]MBC3186561.1 type II secretion protein F [Corynebacterium sp. zg-331]MPV53045.1 type II secretion protein F [Corynebacterium sp. zg331]